jgi:thiol-disulfide isomerase/thioredoxin
MNLRSALLKTPTAIASAALLALFAGACQPADKAPSAAVSSGAAGVSPAAAAPAAPAGAPTQLAAFKTGAFKELDTDQDLSIPTKPFMDTNGKPHTFAEYKGKVVVFNLWGSWCAPCIEEMPSLVKLQEAFPSGDVVILPIATEDKPDKARTLFAKLTGGKLPFHYDTTFDVSMEAHSQSFPTTIIYGRDGKEAARLILPADWGSEQAKGLVQAIADGKS